MTTEHEYREPFRGLEEYKTGLCIYVDPADGKMCGKSWAQHHASLPGWAVMNDSHSVTHWFESDDHPRVPLLVSICKRYTSNDVRGHDIIEREYKHCGDCVRLLAERQES